MMHQLWRLFGTALFWLLWPLIWIYAPVFLRCRVLVVANKQVLVINKWLGPSQWLLPGGGKHFGESEAEAAARELYEETGIGVEPRKLKPLGSRQFHTQFGIVQRLSCFYIELSQPMQVRPRPREIVDAAWLKFADIQQLSPNNEVRIALDAMVKLGLKMVQ